jgi:hypothetical protein
MEDFDYTDSLELKKTSEGIHPMSENPEDAIARTEKGDNVIYLYEQNTNNMDLENSIDEVASDKNTAAKPVMGKVPTKKTVLPLTNTVISAKKPTGKRVSMLDKATNTVFKIIFNKK